MRYCFFCGRATSGKPLFCNSCGRSYDVRLCQRLHVNPRHATVCSQCGSSELSTPQPKISVWWKVFTFLLQVAGGVLLVYISLAVLLGLLRSPVVQSGMVVLGLLLMLLWAVWALLPEWIRKVIHRLVIRKEHRDER